MLHKILLPFPFPPSLHQCFPLSWLKSHFSLRDLLSLLYFHWAIKNFTFSKESAANTLELAVWQSYRKAPVTCCIPQLDFLLFGIWQVYWMMIVCLCFHCLQPSIYSTNSCQYLCEKHSNPLSISENCYVCIGYSVLNFQGYNWE